MPKKIENGIKLERDMYAPVKAYLMSQGWDVKAEVDGCDAAALRDGVLLMAEMKLTLNLDVILQAVGRQSMADVVYVAVPAKPGAMRTQRWRDTLALLKRLNIGLLAVTARTGFVDVEELIEPEMPETLPPAEAPDGDRPCAPGKLPSVKRLLSNGRQPSARAVRRRVRVMKELNGRSGDWNTGGVHQQKLMTAYRESALRLAVKLAGSEPMSAKDLKPAGEKSRGTYLILTANHYGWFRKMGGGLFALTDEGRAGLKTYEGIVAIGGEPEEDVFSGTVEY